MLMLSIVFLAAAQYQLVVVPQEEQAEEIDHQRLVSSQMGQLHADILAASANGAQSAQRLDVGREYEDGLVFGIIPEIHGPNPVGTIKNEPFVNQIQVRNAEGIGSSSNYWPGGLSDPCGDPNHCYDTTSFVYDVTYNQYQDNPTIVYENTFVYDYYENDPATSADDQYQFTTNQNIVQGRSVNLVSLTGDLNQARVSPATIQTLPISAPAQTITIRQDDPASQVTFQVPSRVPADIWEDQILADQMATNPDGYVESVTNCGFQCVELTMKSDEVYTLKLSRVHLTTREEQSAVPVEKAAYIAWKGNDRLTIRENSTTEIRAQVRDRFNNGVPGINTIAFARDANDDCIGSFRSGVGNSCTTGSGQTVQQEGEQTSGENGDVVYYYVAPDVRADRAISIQLELNDPANTVSNSLVAPDPQLVAGLTTPTVNSLPEVGHLNPAKTLRLTNIEFETVGVNAHRPTQTTLSFDNTGPTFINTNVNIGGTGGIVAEPTTLALSLAPGEYERHTLDISFREAGTQRLFINGYTYVVSVAEPSTGIAPATIVNRRAKETLNKTPTAFKDGDRGDEFRETKNIPPVEYNPTTETYDSTARGNLYQFSNIATADDAPTYIDADTSYPTAQSLRVGLNIDRVADNDYYYLVYDYSYANNPGTLQYDLVKSDGTPIDTRSEYHLSYDGPDSTRIFQLTDEEARYLNSANELFIVLYSTSQTTSHPELRLDRVSLLSKESPLVLTSPQINIQPASIGTTTSTVEAGEKFTITADITNSGSAAAEVPLALFQNELGNPDTDVIRTGEVVVNPEETKTVQFTVYEYNPGTYQFRIGTDGTPDTNPVGVTVEHKPATP
jgi:hypothetical protein